MILSEYDRRWAEIRLYQFCVEIYNYRHQSIDVFDCIDMVCDFAELKGSDIKALVQVMLSDTYYKATRREIIIIGDVKGMSAYSIAKYLDMTRQGVTKFLKTNKATFVPLPRCSVEDDYKIIQFLKTLEKLRKLGSLGDGTIN